jgi:hypothetical protein
MNNEDMIFLGIVVLAIVVIFITRPLTEYMTNKDLVSALQTHGTSEAKKKAKDEPSELEIYGPKAEKVLPTKSSGKSSGSDTSGSYPDIYGPDIPLVPGTKTKSMPGTKPKSMPGKHTSDEVDDETYDFNPDLQKAFPTEGPPQPFLTDFSKFQH